MNTTGSPRRIVLLQAGGMEHFARTVQNVRNQFPDAEIIGVVKLCDHTALRSVEDWHALFVWDGVKVPAPLSYGRQQEANNSIDLCVLPVEDRFGIRFWRARLVAWQLGSKRVVLVNRDNLWGESGRMGWLLRSVWASAVLRYVQVLYHGLLTVWNPVRQQMAIAALFTLACLAIVIKRCNRVGRETCATKISSPGEMKPRRVVIFIPSLGMGGAQKALINFLTHVSPDQYGVEVCTINMPDKFFEESVRRCQVRLTHLDCPSDTAYWRIVIALVRHLFREKPEIAIGWLPWATMFMPIAASIARVPRVLISLHSQSPARFPQSVPWWYRPLDILVGKMVDVTIACSDACRDDYMQWSCLAPNKIRTVYNGVDSREFSHVSATRCKELKSQFGVLGHPIIGIVGRLSPEKEHRIFLEAVKIVQGHIPSVRALVLGDGPEETQLKEAAQAMGVSSSVVFLGRREDAIDVIACMDVLVLSSRTEGFPVVLLEGQALGIPVVTTDAGGAREAVKQGETGYVVNCGNSQEIADQIIDLMNNERRRAQFGVRARQWIHESFAAEHMTTSILQLCSADVHEGR